MQNISDQLQMFQGEQSASDIQKIKSSLLSDGLARIILLLENAKGKELVHEAVYCLKQVALSLKVNANLSLLKTSKGFPLSMTVMTSTKQLDFLPTLIQTVHNTHWNVSFLIQLGYYPKIERGSTLSDILEKDVSEEYFLSQKTISGLMKGQAKPKVLEP